MTGKHGRKHGWSGRPALAAVAFAAMMAMAGAAIAEEMGHGHGGGHYDRISLQAERSRQVPNDTVLAQVGITVEDSDAVEAQYRVNQVMEWAVEVSTHYEDVKAQTGGYRAHPVYKDQLIDHWRATQELRIESQNIDRVTELVRVLQSRMQLQSVAFSVSEQAREAAENELIESALGAFKQRSELVRNTLGASSYRIVHVSIGSGGTVPAPMPMRAMAAMSEASAAPALEPGTSTVTVTVDGTLELRN